MDRFDLEQKIMNCWSVVEDMALSNDPYTQALAIVYATKFEDLFACFEQVVKEGKLQWNS